MADRPNPIQFLQQVRAEAAKIVWPSRRETGISTVMVIIMAAFASIFFLVADQVMSRLVTLLLGIGTGTATGG
jgi:preprotein translocase subunit SecE